MLFSDRLTLGQPRTTNDGYMAVRARAARAGIYEYLGREIDPEATTFAADQVVRVYRPEEEVFHTDSVASFLMKPVTNDHPSKPVTADNWRDHAKGVIGKALRDGEFLAFDIVIMDKATIKAVEDGKRELSNGYASEISFETGQSPSGQRYDAVQRKIRGNHVAVVDKARAGSDCRISDCATCAPIPGAELEKILADDGTYNPDFGDGTTANIERRETSNSGGSHVATKTITFDGLPLEVTDAAEAAITKLQSQIKEVTDGRAADKVAHDKVLATKDAEIDDLKTKVVDQAKIDALADAKAAVVADAKKIVGDKLGETAGKSVAEVRRMACVAALGDAALKDKSDEYVEARFDTLKDGKPAERDDLRDAIRSGASLQVNDSGVSVRDLARANQF